MTEFQGSIFFPLYLLFGVWLGLLLVAESECVCVCVFEHLCVSVRQKRTCPHKAGLDAAIFWFASLKIRDWLYNVPVFHHRKVSLPLNKSHEQTRVTSGNGSTTQCVYYSSALKLEYLSFSAEWLLRGNGSHPLSHCTEDSPLLCITDTTATGCSEIIKFCYIAPHPHHVHSFTLLIPSANLREKRVILWEIILCFHCHLKGLGGWAGHPGNSMTPKDPKNYFSSLTAGVKKTLLQFCSPLYLAFVAVCHCQRLLY